MVRPVARAVLRKHPRSRGDDRIVIPKAAATSETPPLARGRSAIRERQRDPDGNTPARAGTISGKPKRRQRVRKHPRSRGDDRSYPRLILSPLETPPLARGRSLFGVDARLDPGNTPARAGTMAFTRVCGSDPRKHPRSRGDDT